MIPSVWSVGVIGKNGLNLVICNACKAGVLFECVYSKLTQHSSTKEGVLIWAWLRHVSHVLVIFILITFD